MNTVTAKDVRSLIWRLATHQFSGDTNGQSVNNGKIKTSRKEKNQEQMNTLQSSDDLFPSDYLKASDLPEKGTTPGTMRTIDIQSIGKEKKQKPVIELDEFDGKLWVLNKTNRNSIEKAVGSKKLKDWIGKTVYLYRAMVEYQGEPTESIRVKSNPDNGATSSEEMPI
jgi:hypothetical protein